MSEIVSFMMKIGVDRESLLLCVACSWRVVLGGVLSSDAWVFALKMREAKVGDYYLND